MRLKYKFLATMLATSMAVSPATSALQSFGVTPLTAHAASNTITSQNDLIAACKKSGTYTLTKSVKVTKRIEVSANVVIKSNSENNIISTNSDISSIFYVNGNDAKLTLGASTDDANRVAVRGGTSTAGLTTSAPIVVDNGATLVINRAHIYRSNGSVIKLKGRSVATMKAFTGKDGLENSVNDTRPSKNYFGAVAILENSTFNFKGGTISGSSSGGVTVRPGSTLNMSNGKITNCSGGAGDPDVNGDKVGSTVATDFGGGIFNCGTVNLTGGTIVGNSCKYGGGIYNNTNGTVNFTGGTLSNNTASSKGNGIYNKGTINVGGECLVASGETTANEIYLDSGKINITSELKHSPAFTVKLPENKVGTTIATCTGNMTAENACKAIDVVNKGDCVLAARNNEVILSKFYKLSYDYNSDGTVDGTPEEIAAFSKFTVPTKEEIMSKSPRVGYQLVEDGMNGSDGKTYTYGTAYELTSNLTLTAKWIPCKYTVSYDMNGGVGSIPSVSTKFDTGFTVEYTNLPTRTGYDFVGWADNKADADAEKPTYTSATNVQYKYVSDITLYAVWKPQVITIIYNTNSGSSISPTIGSYAKKPVVTAEQPVRDGYRFMGWYDPDGNKVAAGNTMDRNITLKAKWEESAAKWNVKLTKTSTGQIKLFSGVNTAVSYGTKLKKALTLTVKATRTTSEGTTNAVVSYQIVKKGKTYIPSDAKWKAAKNGKIVVKNAKNSNLYIRVSSNGYTSIYKTNGFTVDSTAPTIKGVKNNKMYKHAVTVRVSDNVSGVKSITLNGKKISSTKKITKNGAYKLVVTDKVGHKKTVRFSINK